jgi:hypothetical protein
VKSEIVKPEAYLFLSEVGIDIDACEIDFGIVSVKCEDLSRYRKALRVKIRALMKQNDLMALKRYADALYALALFAKHLYGFHSCSSDVELWQEEKAKTLQKSFDLDKHTLYDGEHWIHYDDVVRISCEGLQDGKPFLTLKDKAHFDRLF